MVFDLQKMKKYQNVTNENMNFTFEDMQAYLDAHGHLVTVVRGRQVLLDHQALIRYIGGLGPHDPIPGGLRDQFFAKLKEFGYVFKSVRVGQGKTLTKWCLDPPRRVFLPPVVEPMMTQVEE